MNFEKGEAVLGIVTIFFILGGILILPTWAVVDYFFIGCETLNWYYDPCTGLYRSN